MLIIRAVIPLRKSKVGIFLVAKVLIICKKMMSVKISNKVLL